MTSAVPYSSDAIKAAAEQGDLHFELPDPEDDQLSDYEFHQRMDAAWQVCDRFDLQTDIWRGAFCGRCAIAKKRGGDGRGYRLFELAEGPRNQPKATPIT